MATNTYGDSGNRWWVGLNISSGVLSGSQTNGYESLPSGDAADDAVFAKAAKADAGGKPSQAGISVHNIQWFNINGPYTSQSQANAAIPAIQKANPAPGELQKLKQANIPGVSPAAGAAQTAEQTVGSVTDFLSGLTSANLWIRIAKVVLGGAILLIGIAKLTGFDKKASGVAKQAISVAPFV